MDNTTLACQTAAACAANCYKCSYKSQVCFEVMYSLQRWSAPGSFVTLFDDIRGVGLSHDNYITPAPPASLPAPGAHAARLASITLTYFLSANYSAANGCYGAPAPVCGTFTKPMDDIYQVLKDVTFGSSFVRFLGSCDEKD
jgi:hypothetical protein